MFSLPTLLAVMSRARGYHKGRFARQWAGARRVIAYALFVSLVLGVVAARRAQASNAEAVRGLGRDLLALQDLLEDGKELNINGETIHVVASYTEASVHDTLDRFAKHCDENRGVLGQDWAKTTVEAPSDLPTDASGVAKKEGTFALGTFRSGDDNEGVVMCIVKSETSPKTLEGAIARFQETQDLGAFGKMRYAYVKKAPKGATILTAWTDDHFSFKALAPENGGDAPGKDSPFVPRPANAQRLLSADVVGTSYGVRVYGAPGTVEQVTRTNDEAMKARGFKKVVSAERRPGETGYLQGGLFVTVVVAPSNTNGVTVSIAELGSNDTKNH